MKLPELCLYFGGLFIFKCYVLMIEWMNHWKKATLWEKQSVRNCLIYTLVRASLVAQMIKNLPAMQETQVGSLGWEDPLEKGMATHFRNLAWRIPPTEEPGGLQSLGLQRVGHDWTSNIFTFSNTQLTGNSWLFWHCRTIHSLSLKKSHEFQSVYIYKPCHWKIFLLVSFHKREDIKFLYLIEY